jgi:hypothetical protein
VECYGAIGMTRILHAVQSDLITHVGDLILMVNVFAYGHHWSFFVFVFGPCIPRLLQLALENFDKAVCIRVVVNTAAHAGTPTQNEHVVLAIANVHEVACVPANIQCKCQPCLMYYLWGSKCAYWRQSTGWLLYASRTCLTSSVFTWSSSNRPRTCVTNLSIAKC